MEYNGYRELILTDEQYQELYTQKTLTDFSFNDNEYLLVKDTQGEICDKLCFQNGHFRPVKFGTINNKYVGQIKPRNLQQILAVDMLQDSKTKIKLLRGVFGSGKDLLMVGQALTYLEQNKFSKIIFLRSNITVGELPDIGALPGTVDDKLSWTLGPLYDKVGGQEGIDDLTAQGLLEAPPLLHIRGRSFEHSLIYVTEAQNMSVELAKLITSRVGEGSELWLNADNKQVDKKLYTKDNGVNRMVERWAGQELFGYVYLPITERSDVANMANLLD